MSDNGFKAMYDLGYDTFKDVDIKRAYEIISSTRQSHLQKKQKLWKNLKQPSEATK